MVDASLPVSNLHPSLSKVILVGGPDIDARLELMHRLKDTFNISALGSLTTLHDRFLAEGFGYSSYRLGRQVNPLSDLWTLGQLVFMLNKLKPQIVHTFDTKPGVWARLAARLTGIPIIIGTLPGLGSLYASDNLKTRFFRSVYQPLQTLACRISDLTIFQNRDDAHHFIASGIVSEQKATVILGSGVSTDLYNLAQVSDLKQAQLRVELSIQPQEIVVTMVSRLLRSKGVLEFMDAAKEVGTRSPDVYFLLIGPEDDESGERLKSEELTQLKQAVSWPGPRSDIRDVLAVSDIFVFPSAYGEGIPRVLLEAASMGLPIVTTDSPGCNEVVEHGVNGFLVPVRDSAALGQAITRLIEHPELRQRFGRISRQRAVERFDLSIVADQMRSLYMQLLARKGLVPDSVSQVQRLATRD